ncbi:hypothetical protein EK21DRAFT_118182 [Setomelanomma holmii]|uniref:Uncharacterized protein n=1 Tax=Setomelanomma holmii TaxID=210430 RepID=A0A9P4LG69_9PLEO|nr:hypothetical protein EK21DRAFT_118182 [Setomelanomma holmii]
MCEPFSLGAIFASVGSAFKFADLAIRVAEVGSENEVFVRTIRVVRDDLNEVERLLNDESVRRKVTSIPGKLPWIKGAVHNTKSALNEIGKWVEHARAEQESTGSIRFETRVRWVFNDHEKLLNRKTELMTCHQQLSNVLGYLIRLEDVPTTSQPPQYLDSTFFDDVLSRHKRRTIWPDQHANLQLEKLSKSTPSIMTVPPPSLTTRRDPILAPSLGIILIDQPNPHVSAAETWPKEPSCSPPPTYSSVITTSGPSGEAHPITENSGAHTQSHVDCLVEQDYKSRVSFSNDGETLQKSNITWAYKYADQDDSVPELAGDTVCMSGTNSLGPVNPFDFSAEPLPPQNNFRRTKRKEPTTVVEALNDLTFAVELPVNDPGPPPGYPSRPKHVSLPVPPFYPFERREEHGTVFYYGRGTVDAKGPVATMIVASHKFLESRSDTPSLGMLFVVGEGTGGTGMKAFASYAKNTTFRAAIFGEPTEGKLASGHKEAVVALNMLEPALPRSELLGATTLNTGLIRGGVAGNVVAEAANASVSIRNARSEDDAVSVVRDLIIGMFSPIVERAAEANATFSLIFANSTYPAPILDTDVEGLEIAPVFYGTDIPSLPQEEKRYLFGTGTIEIAHTPNEGLSQDQLVEAAEAYSVILRSLIPRRLDFVAIVKGKLCSSTSQTHKQSAET